MQWKTFTPAPDALAPALDAWRQDTGPKVIKWPSGTSAHEVCELLGGIQGFDITRHSDHQVWGAIGFLLWLRGWECVTHEDIGANAWIGFGQDRAYRRNHGADRHRPVLASDLVASILNTDTITTASERFGWVAVSA